MNMQNMISQLMASSNPMQMMMSLLNPQGKQALNSFKNKNKEQQAEELAKLCNENGITKEQLQQIIGMVK